MSHPESDHGHGRAASESDRAASETRIDRPHGASITEESGAITDEILGEAFAEISASDEAVATAVELHHQADELAAYLRTRLKEIQQRESQLNAQSAQLDESFSEAQARINEGQADLARRERELADREQELENHAQSHPPKGTKSESDALDGRVRQLRRREAALLARRQELGRVYSHAIQMCGAAEELGKELSRGANRAALAKAMHTVQTLAAERHRAQERELTQKKRRLEKIRRQLSQENQRLQERDRQLRRWFQERALSLQRRAAQLAAKEAKLLRRQAAEDDLG